MLKILGQSAYWQVNKSIANIIGIEATLLLSDIIDKKIYFENENKLTSFYKNGVFYEDYFFNSAENIEKDTTLSQYKQKEALIILKGFNLVDVVLAGNPAILHFKPLEDNILEFLKISFSKNLKQDLENFINKFSKNLETSFQKFLKQVFKKFETNNNKEIRINNNSSKEELENFQEKNNFISLDKKEKEKETDFLEKQNGSEILNCSEIGQDTKTILKQDDQEFGNHELNVLEGIFRKYNNGTIGGNKIRINLSNLNKKILQKLEFFKQNGKDTDFSSFLSEKELNYIFLKKENGKNIFETKKIDTNTGFYLNFIFYFLSKNPYYSPYIGDVYRIYKNLEIIETVIKSDFEKKSQNKNSVGYL